ncbi:hypothetical protein [Streptomyces sp. NPDC005799]|uniref:hypothetical protein n=1 Tax=Streptomyces sp. NPDC005799 TaxID=3154678 RepID=UPI003400424B
MTWLDPRQTSSPSIATFGLTCVVNLSTEPFQLPGHTAILLASGPVEDGLRTRPRGLAQETAASIWSTPSIRQGLSGVHSPPIGQALARTAPRPQPERRYKRSCILIHSS